jgi:hypothetical protein
MVPLRQVRPLRHRPLAHRLQALLHRHALQSVFALIEQWAFPRYRTFHPTGSSACL